MFPALPLRARWTAFVIACLSAASLVAIFVYNMQTERYGSEAETLWAMARFFTILSHVLIVLTFLTAAFRRDGISAPWVAALTLTIVLVGAVYHALLRGIVEFTGLGLWADIGLHSVVPIAVLLWWLVFAPKRRLRYGDLPMFIVWPCVYVAYALGRGASDGTYPYPFMDVPDLGPAVVATNLAGLLIALLLGGVIFVMMGRFADR